MTASAAAALYGPRHGGANEAVIHMLNQIGSIDRIPQFIEDVKFGKGGEWAEGRMLQVQYHDIKNTELEQFRGMDTQTVLTPDKYKTGDAVYPFEKAK